MDFLEYYHIHGAVSGIAPLVIAGLISLAASAKASEDNKQAATAQAAGSAAGGEGGGFDMKPTNLLAEAAGPSPAQAEGSKINESILKADGQAPPASIAIPSVEPGTGPLPQGPPVDLDSGFPGDVGPNLPEGGDPSKMSLEAKMAMAAQLGSLMRGPAPPRPPSVGAGPGINMQPVFLKDLQRG